MIEFEKLCCSFFSVLYDGILFILTGNDDIHKSLDEFEIWPDQTTGFRGSRLGYNGKNGVTLFSAVFHPILFILADYNKMHENSEEFEIWPDLTTDCRVSCL